MAKGFWQSKLAFWGVILLGVVLSVLLWIRDQGYPIYIPILASSLALAISYCAGRVISNLVANSMTTKCLGYLHMELDPDKFIDAYGQVPGRLCAGSRSRAIAHAYLSDGYAAKGDFTTALSLLEAGFSGIDEKEIALRGLYLSDKGACLNGLGDQEAAEETLADLRSLIDGCWHSKNALARNLQDGLLLLEADLCLQQGRLPEIKPLEEIYEQCAYNLRRFEIDRLLALRAMAVGNKEEAKHHLSVLADNGGKTRYAAWACAQLNGAK